ncbi:MAG: alpha/beta fold hydrolase [Mycobacteriaceae bacterium]|nr:alpha/beta fold hydrolase [Mycobacteriaceae bacterium]
MEGGTPPGDSAQIHREVHAAAVSPAPAQGHVFATLSTHSVGSLGHTEGVETVEYARGRPVDLYGDHSKCTVLLWHGAQTDARTTLLPLAQLVADHGFGVVVPDWNSHADDGGRGDLLRSVHFARRVAQHRERLVLVGWSLGGVAAAGLTVHAQQHGVQLGHTVCLAGAFMVRDPISGERLETELADTANRSPFTLLHGVADDVVPIGASRAFASTLERHGWPVDFVELRTDHGGIAGATYDAGADRYSAAHDQQTLAVATDVARRIAAVIAPG